LKRAFSQGHLSLRDWRAAVLAALAFLVLCGVTTLLLVRCVRAFPANDGASRKRKPTRLRWLKRQTLVLQVGLLVLTCGWFLLAALFQKLPWQPVTTVLLTGPPVAVLVAMLSEQCSLLGRGLNMKQRHVTKGSERPAFTWARLRQFLGTVPPVSFAPMRAEIRTELSLQGSEDSDNDDGDTSTTEASGAAERASHEGLEEDEDAVLCVSNCSSLEAGRELGLLERRDRDGYGPVSLSPRPTSKAECECER